MRCHAVLALWSLSMTAMAAYGTSAWDLVHPAEFHWQDRAERVQLAQDLMDRIRILAAVVPPMSADELAKLRKEQTRLNAMGDDAPRRSLGRLYLSRPYQHQKILELLDNTLGALDCAAQSQKIAAEMACWAQASTYLLEEASLDLGLTILREGRLIPKDEDMPVKAQDPVIWYGEYGRGVLNYIVVPYLQGTLGQELR